MTIVDLEEYKQRKREEESCREMKKLIKRLDDIADYAYEHYNRTEQEGYERFKRLLKGLDARYDPDTKKD